MAEEKVTRTLSPTQNPCWNCAGLKTVIINLLVNPAVDLASDTTQRSSHTKVAPK